MKSTKPTTTTKLVTTSKPTTSKRQLYKPKVGAHLSSLCQQRADGINLQPLESRTFDRRATENLAVSFVGALLPVAIEQPGCCGLQQVAEILLVAEEVNNIEPPRASMPVTKFIRQGARNRISEALSDSDFDGEGGTLTLLPKEPKTKVSSTLVERMARRKTPLRLPCECKKQDCREKLPTERQR